MTTDDPDWKDLTPSALISAVTHIRKRFEETEFILDFASQQKCYKELHPVTPPDVGPAVFKKYMDLYQLGLKEAVRKEFDDLLAIGLANVELLNQVPVDWAKSHVELLIAGKQYLIRHWIKNVCDQQPFSQATTPEHMEEFIHWRSWRAPRLVAMQPSANIPYNPELEWFREDQETTERFLSALSDRFVDSLIFYLERIAGEAHVELAKKPGTGRAPAILKTVKKNTSEQKNKDNDPIPRVFISYSWDSPDHKQWVLELAFRLQGEGGIQIILDRWHLPPGGDRTIFMEKSVGNSKFVVLICTPNYARRANDRDGGVGYEATIITGELAENINQGKFIPVLRDGDWRSALPSWIKTKAGVDLRGNPYSQEQYQELLRALHQEPLMPPPVGPKPSFA